MSLSPSARTLLIRAYSALPSALRLTSADWEASEALDDLGLAVPQPGGRAEVLELTPQGRREAALYVKAEHERVKHEAQEVSRAIRHEAEINRASLADRREAQSDYFQAMQDPEHFARMASWLLDGTMGVGEQILARRILDMKRGNKQAALAQYLAVVNWRCPRRMAADAWKRLTPAQQTALADALGKVLGNAEKEGV